MYEIKYREKEEMLELQSVWFNQLPKSWDAIKLKYIAGYQKGRNPKELVSSAIGNDPYVTASYLRTGETDDYVISNKGLITVEDGDLLLLWDGANAGEFFEGKQGVLGSTFAKLTTNIKFCISFFKYTLKSTENYLKLETNGMGVPHINSNILKNLILVSPNIDEQKKIANFLDIKTAQFDSIISKKEQLIQKLEEAKKSLISEVVTGKVKIVDGKLVERDPSEMKDSGVEWLGMVPIDWEVKFIKHISRCYPSNIDKKSKNGEISIKLCNYTDVYYNDYITKDLDFMNATATYAQILKFGLRKGDIILTKDSESPDDIGIASYVIENIENLVCGYHLTQIRVNSKYDSMYIYYYLLSEGVKNYFEIVANGVTRYGIGVSGFLKLSVTIPSLNEQNSISKYISKQIELNNSLICKTKNQIEKLNQAKQSLISEAVTGKIDLRDWEIIEEGELQ